MKVVKEILTFSPLFSTTDDEQDKNMLLLLIFFIIFVHLKMIAIYCISKKIYFPNFLNTTAFKKQQISKMLGCKAQ